MRMPRHAVLHDGYPVGYVPRRWLPLEVAVDLPSRCIVAALHGHDRDAPLRQLGSRALDAVLVIDGVRLVGARCTCGWRSPPLWLGAARWEHSAVYTSRRADSALEAIWRAHASALEQRQRQRVAPLASTLLHVTASGARMHGRRA